jgi:hypothetical protein
MDTPSRRLRDARAWMPMLLVSSLAVASMASTQASSATGRAPAAGEGLRVGVGHSRIAPGGEDLRIAETLETKLAKDLGRRLGTPVAARRADNTDPLALLRSGSVDAVLAALPDAVFLPPAWEKSTPATPSPRWRSCAPTPISGAGSS